MKPSEGNCGITVFDQLKRNLKAEVELDKDREFPSTSYQAGLLFALGEAKRLESEYSRKRNKRRNCDYCDKGVPHRSCG